MITTFVTDPGILAFIFCFHCSANDEPQNKTRVLMTAFKELDYSSQGFLEKLQDFEEEINHNGYTTNVHALMSGEVRRVDESYNKMIHQINASAFAKYW